MKVTQTQSIAKLSWWKMQRRWILFPFLMTMHKCVYKNMFTITLQEIEQNLSIISKDSM